jgi:hypothetical protein
VLCSLGFSRIEQIAQHFRLLIAPGSSWEHACAQVLQEPAAHPVALLHQLAPRELAGVCRRAGVSDEGPTQDMLARLIPLCSPSSGGF